MKLKIRISPKPITALTSPIFGRNIRQDNDIITELVGIDALVIFDELEIRAEIDPPPKIWGLFAPIIDDLQQKSKLTFNVSFLCDNPSLPDELYIDYLDEDMIGFSGMAQLKQKTPPEHDGDLWAYEYTIEDERRPGLSEQYTISNDSCEG